MITSSVVGPALLPAVIGILKSSQSNLNCPEYFCRLKNFLYHKKENRLSNTKLIYFLCVVQLANEKKTVGTDDSTNRVHLIKTQFHFQL